MCPIYGAKHIFFILMGIGGRFRSKIGLYPGLSTNGAGCARVEGSQVEAICLGSVVTIVRGLA
jgi:hypothetical protein